jgi:putative ABC transport system ATP-binding protein
MQGINKEAAAKKSMIALEKVDLAHELKKLPSQISGGQQQRVSIARAIGHDPKILFADEPTANLDSETSRDVLSAFMELHNQGQTIVMVTHEKEYAEMTDRIITIRDGEIISDVVWGDNKRNISKELLV